METLDTLKNAITDLLSARLGNLSDLDLLTLKQRADALGMDERSFSHLLQEVHVGINWSALRDKTQGKDRVSRPVNIFNQEVKSLEKLGSVLYENRTKALRYLEDGVMLKENVVYLSHQDVDLTLEVMDLYGSEPNGERRFLKTCYRLNDTLPFIVLGKSFDKPDDLFTSAWLSHDFFVALFNKFTAGHLQLWLSGCFPQIARLIRPQGGYQDFLYLLYSYDAEYPLYIGTQAFWNTQEIVIKTQKDIAFWGILLDAVKDNSLYIWLERKGMDNLVADFKSKESELDKTERNTATRDKVLVQRLLETLSQDVHRPSITLSDEKISLLNIQADKLQHPILITLKDSGFVRGNVVLDKQIPGISLSLTKFSLSDLEFNTSASLNLLIDPSKLQKDKRYAFSIKILTDYQSLTVPVDIKTVFPMQAVLFCLLRYGFFGGLFLGLVRLLMATANGGPDWLKPELAWQEISLQVPLNHPAYILLLVLLISIPVLLWPKIKKMEQL